MNILIACDKFKGSLSARKVCAAIAHGLQQRDPQVTMRLLPMADGGDGSLDILADYQETIRMTVSTIDPLGRPLEAYYLLAGTTAYVELAEASGLVRLAENERNPLYTDTRGTGILIEDAIKQGAEEVVLLAGGSSTNDLALGIAQALGYRFLAENGEILKPIGRNLGVIHQIERPQSFALPRMTVLSDVTNPLYGPNGAAYVYGPQKGASPKEVALLDQGLRHMAALIQTQLGVHVHTLEGGGCAGGIGAGMVGLLGAQLKPGFQTLSEWVDLRASVQWADWVISGEGKLDTSSLQGKVVGGVAELCKGYGKRMMVCAGINQLDPTVLVNTPIEAVFDIASIAKDLEDAMARPAYYLAQIGANLNLS